MTKQPNQKNNLSTKINSNIEGLMRETELKRFQNKKNEEKRLKENKARLLEERNKLKNNLNNKKNELKNLPFAEKQYKEFKLSKYENKLKNLNTKIKNINSKINTLPEKYSFINYEKRFERTMRPNKGLNEFTQEEINIPYQSTLFNLTNEEKEYQKKIENEFKKKKQNEFRNFIKSEFNKLNTQQAKTRFYRKEAVKHHPNKGGNEEFFKILQTEYNKLKI